GETVVLTADDVEGTAERISGDYKGLAESCESGMKVLLDDGLLELRVVEVKGTDVVCLVVFGGELKERKGVNIPGARLRIDCLTEKDLRDLEFGLNQQVDYIALSFVRHENDVRQLRERM